MAGSGSYKAYIWQNSLLWKYDGSSNNVKIRYVANHDGTAGYNNALRRAGNGDCTVRSGTWRVRNLLINPLQSGPAGQSLSAKGRANAYVQERSAASSPTAKPAKTITNPKVESVYLFSTAGDDNTYHLKEKIRVAVRFDEPVRVNANQGTPRLRIDMKRGPGGVERAVYIGGSGTQELLFEYIVRKRNTSTEGVRIIENSLNLGGGIIRHDQFPLMAELGHSGVDHDPTHMVSPTKAEEAEQTVFFTTAFINRKKIALTFDTDLTQLSARQLSDLRYAFTISGTDLEQHPTKIEYHKTRKDRILMWVGTPARRGQLVTIKYSGSKLTHRLRTSIGVTISNFATELENRTPIGVHHTTVSISDASVEEGPNAYLVFRVRLSRPALASMVITYRTEDITATNKEDYQGTPGRRDSNGNPLPDTESITLGVGEKEYPIYIPVYDDALDEGSETLRVRLVSATGVQIVDRVGIGTITNSDPLQTAWLSQYGQTVADNVVDAVAGRLNGPPTHTHVTIGGQPINLGQAHSQAPIVEEIPAFSYEWLAGRNAGWNDPAATSAPRSMTGRELLLGSAFHLSTDGDGAGPGLAAWGRVTVGGFDGEAPADDGSVGIDGDVTTGILGADAQWQRLLAGVAVSVSEGEGTFSHPGVDSGAIESTMTTVSPYARLALTERISAWGLLGFGTGDMTITQAANDRGQPERVTRTDIAMRLGAVGGRGALLEAGETGGIDLALKADAFWVETESEAVSNERSTTADASRVRLALEGSRAFRTDGGGVFTPGLEVGLRHDGGDAETGTGVELGGRLSWADADSGLSAEARVRTLIAHEDSGYEEWGASGSVRLDPGERGRGALAEPQPHLGRGVGRRGRLWSARDARGLAPGREFEPESRLQAELGYGLGLFGDRFTGTPNLGLGFSNAARDWRIGWRLNSAVRGDPGFEVNLDATRLEAANDNEPAEHGVMLWAAIRW